MFFFRQPEFTQLDMELAFTDQNEIKSVIEGIIRKVWRESLGYQKIAFPVITYQEAMRKFGSDKPDTRYELHIHDITKYIHPSILKSSGFKDPCVELISLDCNLSAKDLEILHSTITQESFKHYGGEIIPKNLILRKVSSRNDISEMIWLLNGSEISEISKLIGHGENVFLNIRPGGYRGGHTIMGRLRLLAAKMLMKKELLKVPSDSFKFLWVVDFPLFTPVENPGSTNDSGKLESTHHPFTAPAEEDFDILFSKPGDVRGQHYDLVLNGQEIGGG
jgi:aspartyl-tRNA synthetase